MIRSVSGRRLTAASALAVVLAVAGGSSAFAAVADSNTSNYSAYGVSYQSFARMDSSSPPDAQTWAGPTNKSAPSGYVGARGRMFTSLGNMQCDSGIKYNSSSVAKNSYFIATCTAYNYGSYYSYGVDYAYNGNSYDPHYTYKSPTLTYSASSAKLSTPSAAATSPVGPIRTNDQGLTYGSAAGRTDAELPDLVSVIASNGQSGYVKSSDLLSAEGPVAATLVQARSLAQSQSDSTHTITVYDSTGTSEIGTFLVGGTARTGSL